ncbi:MAG: histidine--tRNA ligase, partial [Ruminococcus sp.]|nr:histidine--tRNA ligase [Ruminococcus sp.]
MANLKVQKPNGTKDVVPSQMYKWNTVEALVKSHAEAYGFKEIRIPTFESTALFVRSVGDTTDVVQKEMYSVTATGDEGYTLRPEGTAGTIRALIENGLLNDGLPQKLFYVLSCFRHEKPQAGRLREFHQFGVEMAGTKDPRADAEVISLAKSILDAAGLRNIQLNINSIGCPECRAKYQQALRDYFAPHIDKMCDTCHTRLEKNPLRLLDCKSEICSEIAKDAPSILDHLCDDCRTHFETLQSYLTAMDIDFKINPRIVRGLDYYTKTVFEFVSEDIGSQGTVCGGGRYDGLIETLSDKPCPALGFGMGLERLILTMENQGVEFAEEETCDIYIGSMGDAAAVKAMQICRALRTDGVRAECDVVGRSVRAQMKYADKLKAKFSLIIGDSELEAGKAQLKDMKSGEQNDIPLDDRFGSVFNAMLISRALEEDGLEDA